MTEIAIVQRDSNCHRPCAVSGQLPLDPGNFFKKNPHRPVGAQRRRLPACQSVATNNGILVLGGRWPEDKVNDRNGRTTAIIAV